MVLQALPSYSASTTTAAAENPASMDEYLASCLVRLARGHRQPPHAQGLSHECTICGKAFSSYQALGGHKSSHSQPPGSSSAGKSRPGIPGVHECNICHIVLATGPALGGHKRKHYFEGMSPPSSVRVVRDIDLNLPPPVEDDDEVQSHLPLKKRRILDLV